MEYKNFNFKNGQPIAWMVFYEDDGVLMSVIVDKEKAERYSKQAYIVVPLYAEKQQ